MSIVIYAGRISRCLEEEYIGGFGSRTIGIQDGGGIFDGYKKRVWRKRQGINKGSRAEKVGARRKDNGVICSRIQESSKRKQI